MQPRMPMHGMGPRMMGPGFGGGGPLMGMNRMPQMPRMNQGMMGRAPQMGQSGGLLSKLFGRGNPSGGMNRLAGLAQPTRAATGGGSMLQSLSNPGGLTGFLNNTQQVLRTAQSLGPMIQQYGPIVKNLPAMWRLYRGFKNVSNETEEPNKTIAKDASSQDQEVESSSSNESSSSSINMASDRIKNKQKRTKLKEKGASIPKLYI